MARKRFISLDFFHDVRISKLSLQAQLAYIASWTILDRNGFFECTLGSFRAQLMPNVNASLEDVEAILEELIKSKRFIKVPYKGQELLFCPTFKKHQTFGRNEKARYSFSDEQISELIKLSEQPTETFLKVPPKSGQFLPVPVSVPVTAPTPIHWYPPEKQGQVVHFDGTLKNELIGELAKTYQSLGYEGNANWDEECLYRLVIRYGAEQAKLAIIGSRVEPETKGFDPRKHFSVRRLVDKPGVFEKCRNLGFAQVEQMNPKPKELTEFQKDMNRISRDLGMKEEYGDESV